ncbi:uncharacterized protein TRIADDRAFT_53475 [Trichoplax adhaerens]|uniref:28S rRNA (uridine-N(3))-methyltransferase n=1 Tax=Trichoplax adhaerens TaxID=10228 RepID=B3RPB5_TRIAD|nr:hypothetical protein TRIADDRAFT_53475 [Trichoplax adhaerens]EDV28159.1 hypothetical protein TRIADDRAFT_53475 [Trichoplax adhaerens]|eukprot:XP_002109993.1 hypothetical protein TRIADDRAFT_53475 [Trichoplax adhaerens]
MGQSGKLSKDKAAKQKKAKHKKKKDKTITKEAAQLHVQAAGDQKAPNINNNIQAADNNIASENKGRPYTVSVAVPGSILNNAQSPELRTYLAGQIARALVIFEVDEVVIFDESGKTVNEDVGEFTGVTRKDYDPNKVLANILQYLECPQYLRKFFFPKHPDLRYAGLLNPLNSTHHMLIDEDVPYREGVTLDRPVGKKGSLVNCGMRKEVRIDRQLQSGLRVTVKLDSEQSSDSKTYKGTVVSADAPRMDAGIYWGYRVRVARSLGAAITECPYEGGYDLSIGTSDGGDSMEELNLSSFKHILIAFGGLSGLEAALESDESLRLSDIRLLFDYYLNTCPGQGSRIIRTEEAMLISLATIRPKVFAAAKSKLNK